jgi:hypothetical protein
LAEILWTLLERDGGVAGFLAGKPAGKPRGGALNGKHVP